MHTVSPRPKRKTPAPDDELIAFSVRVPGWIYNRINSESEAEDRGLNAQVVRMLREWIVRKDAEG